MCFKFKTLKKVVTPSVGNLDYSEMIELAQLRWFGHVIRMETRGTPKWPCKLEHMGRNSEEGLDGLGKKGYRRF